MQIFCVSTKLVNYSQSSGKKHEIFVVKCSKFDKIHCCPVFICGFAKVEPRGMSLCLEISEIIGKAVLACLK